MEGSTSKTNSRYVFTIEKRKWPQKAPGYGEGSEIVGYLQAGALNGRKILAKKKGSSH